MTDERRILAALIGVMAALTLVCVFMPGEQGYPERIAPLLFPWGALSLGMGVFWVASNPRHEDRVRKGLGLALAFLIPLVIAFGPGTLAERVAALGYPLGILVLGLTVYWLVSREARKA